MIKIENVIIAQMKPFVQDARRICVLAQTTTTL